MDFPDDERVFKIGLINFISNIHVYTKYDNPAAHNKTHIEFLTSLVNVEIPTMIKMTVIRITINKITLSTNSIILFYFAYIITQNDFILINNLKSCNEKLSIKTSR
jgi:hypothetical protein